MIPLSRKSKIIDNILKEAKVGLTEDQLDDLKIDIKRLDIKNNKIVLETMLEEATLYSMKVELKGADAKKLKTVVEKQFNSIVAENILKWEEIHPELNKYNFEPADRFAALGQKNKMFVVGHTLVWFHQTPDWVFMDESGKQLNREALLARMKEHIFTVMGRYKGKIHGWDVVNEAILEDGSFRKCKWFER